MTRAAITPGIQPQAVSSNVIKNEPQPWSTTAKGGKIIARITLISDIIYSFLMDVIFNKDTNNSEIEQIGKGVGLFASVFRSYKHSLKGVGYIK